MKRPRWEVLREPVSFTGVALATVSGWLVVAYFVASLLGFSWGGPYGGVLAYLVLPAFLVIGLVLIPLGLARARRRRAREAATGRAEAPLPVLDFNRPRTRAIALAVIVLTSVNVLLLSVAGYKGLEVMDSTKFCGSCHSVMDPEATAHARSPHARVRCVECHIGSGASWFAKSKLSGSWQLVSVTFNLYPRPIPTPVHNLRPARGTCEQCHWPSKFVGDRLHVITRHADDAESTPTKSVVLMHVGGSQGVGAKGIHWHVGPGVHLRYLTDEKREHVSRIELVEPGGKTRVFEGKEPPAPGHSWREMDCVDCHNRPSHIFRTPEEEVDEAIELGRIDRKLPFVRREAVKALKVTYPSAVAARTGIATQLAAFYAKEDPAHSVERQPLLAAAATQLGDIWAANVWPKMNITWGTYPSFLGHDAAPGCFRCHDGEHATKTGEVISNDCNLCHNLLALDEKDPAVLKQLVP